MGAVGTFGINKLANIDPANDVDIWYYYMPNRNEVDLNFPNFIKYPNPSDILIRTHFTDSQIEGLGLLNELNGIYTLNLPLTEFSNKGIYNILITPKENDGVIQDTEAVLSAYPTVRGIVVRNTDFTVASSSLFDNGNLVGYRVEYFNADDGGSREQYYRIITSNNYVEPVSENLSNSNQKAITYRFNDNSNLMFLTLSPSSAPNVKPNALPFIGSVGQSISLVNTKFNPIFLEVEMVENDIDTLTLLVTGDQTHDLERGLITTYTPDKNIYNQVEVYKRKDSYTGKTVYGVRENRGNNIDASQSWFSIVNS
jgi:hypothetical protein